MRADTEPWTPNTTNSYSQFRQATRRHAPSELIPAVAAAASKRAFDKPEQRFQGIHPWVFAAMARDCMLYSNELRAKPVDTRAMQQMHDYFFNSPGWDDTHESTTSIFTMLLGMAYEQTWYQRNVRHELARSYLLYTKTETTPEYEYPTPDDWEDLLGAPFRTAMAASFALFSLTCTHLGAFDPEWPGKPEYSELEELIPAKQLRNVLDLLTTSVQQAKERAKSTFQVPPGLQRYAFNPLIERPFVDLGDGLRYAPQPQFVLRAFETQNLYYRAMQRWGNGFGSVFGAKVEAYTGMQLRHTGEHTIIPEFTWEKNRVGRMRSSDWFLVTPTATILIECKSARMSLEARAGTSAAERLIEQYIGKAYRQLAKNAAELTAGNPAFSHIPADRQLIGLVVTAEPMIGANSEQMRKRFGTDSLPVLTASLEDIEMLSCLSRDTLGEVLLEILADPHLINLNLKDAIVRVLGVDAVPRNRLIDDAFEELTPFSKIRDALKHGKT
jgi:hypothetical protein